MNDLAGRTVLLTGGSRGIGFATAKALGAAGANVVIHYGRHRTGAEEAAQGISEDRRVLVQADLSEPDGANRLWQQALEWRGRVDVLVNNAAVMPQVALSDDDAQWVEAWEQIIQVNVLSPAELIRKATNHYVESGGGVLITMSSWAAQQGSGNPNLIPYAASKAAVAAMTKTVARTYARHHVLAYCISPGAVHTDMTIRSAKNQGGEEAVSASLAMGELVPPAEVAELVATLSTGRHRHLSGATLDVNGATYIR